MKYSKAQIEAITFKDGPCFCIAGPGSGKTSVIIGRCSYLVNHCKVRASDILVVTFTRAAAKEMAHRYMNSTADQNKNATFTTFHSLFFGILKRAYGYNASNIIKSNMQYEIIKGLVAKYDDEALIENDLIKSILEEISIVKNDGIDINNYYSVNFSHDKFRKIYNGYNEYLLQNRLIDFDDMQLFVKELLEQRYDILTALINRYKYIMIDEFQDINRIQYDIMMMLAKEHNNIFAVGDDDQSIYRFRGASVEICFKFIDDFRDVKIIKLSENYRCPSSVVKMSDKLIQNNENRFEKKLCAFNEDSKAITINCYEDQSNEAKAICKNILKYIKEGGRYRDVAILFRTNRQPFIFAQILSQYNIPYTMKEHIPILFEHWIAKDIFTYIKIAQGSRQREDFLKIINRPLRYISRAALSDKIVDFHVLRDYYESQSWMVDRIDTLEKDIRLLAKINPVGAVNYIRGVMGYEEYIKEYAVEKQINKDSLIEVLDELYQSAACHKTYEEWFEEAKRLRQQAIEDSNNTKCADVDGVNIMTLHSAKGLEFDVVFIPDINDTYLPYKKAILDEEIEEERRLLYVGMTRAKKKLHLSCVKKILNHEVFPSPFLKEMGYN